MAFRGAAVVRLLVVGLAKFLRDFAGDLVATTLLLVALRAADFFAGNFDAGFLRVAFFLEATVDVFALLAVVAFEDFLAVLALPLIALLVPALRTTFLLMGPFVFVAMNLSFWFVKTM